MLAGSFADGGFVYLGFVQEGAAFHVAGYSDDVAGDVA
jgi:hypothetical protein